MCQHVFNYPQDKRENYNPDGKTLTGKCRFCNAVQNAYGMRWSIPIEEKFLNVNPYGESQFDYAGIDKPLEMW